jgi:hypothetical protein
MLWASFLRKIGPQFPKVRCFFSSGWILSMSGSNDRQVLNSGFMSSTETASGSAFAAGLNPARSSVKAGRQRSSRLRDRMKARRLLVEGLERRELMAADTAVAMYNPLIANGVAGYQCVEYTISWCSQFWNWSSNCSD